MLLPRGGAGLAAVARRRAQGARGRPPRQRDGGALRGAFPDVAWLYAMTIVMGAGVAVMQVTMPPAVRAWLPERSGFAPPCTPTDC